MALSRHPDTIIIVGAGFSKHAGLPLQSEFTKAMLQGRHKAESPTKELVRSIARFVSNVFDHSEQAKPMFWPTLEDVFTSIDLSANAGHYLGNYKASELRDLRRALITLMMCTLNEAYQSAPRSVPDDWKKLDMLFHALDLERTAFISMNWDTVIERKLAEVHDMKDFDYECDAIRAMPPETGGGCIRLYPAPTVPRARIIKMHGSVNWLYCDRCQRLYWFPPQAALSTASQVLRREQAESYGEPWASQQQWHCSNCNDVELTTRIATFSYRKALDFPMFQKSWFSAEMLLRNAARWVFVGYSLPGADFEFRYLLKRVELSREPPDIIVVTGGDPASVNRTYRNYQGFFGRAIKRKKTFFSHGLAEDSISAIRY